MVGAIIVNWVAVASVCAVIGLAATAGRVVEAQAKRWFGSRRNDEAEDSRLKVAVFGRPANPPYEEVLGLEKRMRKVEVSMSVLLARTEANHGSSLKDQLDKISQHLGIPVSPVSDSQKVPDEA